MSEALEIFSDERFQIDYGHYQPFPEIVSLKDIGHVDRSPVSVDFNIVSYCDCDIERPYLS